MGRDKKTPPRTEPTLPEGSPQVRLAAPADQPTAYAEISKPVTLIGSRRDCDLFIGEDDVSKVHCALVNTGSTIIATDLCSRYGTLVNGQRVSSATLQPGDELFVGSVPVEVKFLEAPDDSAAADISEGEPDLALPTPLQLSGPEQQYQLTTLPAVIGRRHACRILLDTPDVSLAHALLFTIEGRPAIFDLGSRSGTYLNRERVTLAWLRDADLLCIGGVELRLSWAGPQAAKAEVTQARVSGAAGAAKAAGAVARREPGKLAALGSAVAGTDIEAGASQARSHKRAATLDGREAELAARSSALGAEQARLATEKKLFERQAAELRAAAAELEQDRAWFEAQRAQFERERTQLEGQRTEVERRFAEHQNLLSELREREAALGQREAALAAVEQELAEREAELAKREAANAEAVRTIEQLREALSDAQRMFVSAATASAQVATGARRDDAAASPATASDRERGAEDGSLPAPLVDEPLFAGLDPTSPEQWPQELQERLRLLRTKGGKSDADLISQVLAESRAQRSNHRRSSGN